MLQVRMDALRVHLENAQDPLTWKQSLKLDYFNVHGELWNSAVEEVRSAAGTQAKKLSNLNDQLAANEISSSGAWLSFEDIRVRSDEIFRECVELLGGLALRDQMNDPWIWVFADHLLKEYRTVGLRSSFAIPAADEGTLSALRRVVKVGFPEWHIWTLPLVAYEYSYVLIEERSTGPSKLVKSLVKRWLAVAEPADEDVDDVEREANAKARVLVADALATYTSGPAYAAAAIVMRLNPLVQETPDRPSDDQRAAVLLSMLAEMNSAAVNDPYKDIIAGLTEYWERSVEAALGTSRPAPPDSLVDPREFVDSFTLRFGAGINGRYQADSWWASADPLARHWLQQLRSGGQPKLTPPESRGSPSLIDVLNAAWQCRFSATKEYDPGEADEARGAVDRIETAAKELFRSLTKESEGERPRAGRDRAAARRPGRG
jgi:hypothetical protein